SVVRICGVDKICALREVCNHLSTTPKLGNVTLESPTGMLMPRPTNPTTEPCAIPSKPSGLSAVSVGLIPPLYALCAKPKLPGPPNEPKPPGGGPSLKRMGACQSTPNSLLLLRFTSINAAS